MGKAGRGCGCLRQQGQAWQLAAAVLASRHPSSKPQLPCQLRAPPPAASRCPMSADSSGRSAMKSMIVELQASSLAWTSGASVTPSRVPLASECMCASAW